MNVHFRPPYDSQIDNSTRKREVKEMKKRLVILGSCLMMVSVGLTACSQQENAANDKAAVESNAAVANVTVEGNHVTAEITENVKIDAEIQGQQEASCTIYKATGKEFDRNLLETIFWQDTSGLSREEDTEDNTYLVEDTVGGYLGVDSDRIWYQKNDYVQDLSTLVQYCYKQKMKNMSEEEKQTLLQENSVQKAVEILNRICPLKEDEKLSITKGTKIDMEDIIQFQNEKNMSDIKTMTQELLGENAYYITFSLEKQNIPLVSQGEPDFVSVSESVDTRFAGVTMIVDEQGIQFLDMAGTYELTEERSGSILSVQEAAQAVAKEYTDQISEDKVTFDKVWLEYVWALEDSSANLSEGTLQPYWIFVDSEKEWGERINAVTGVNFKYE